MSVIGSLYDYISCYIETVDHPQQWVSMQCEYDVWHSAYYYTIAEVTLMPPPPSLPPPAAEETGGALRLRNSMSLYYSNDGSQHAKASWVVLILWKVM